MIEIDKEKKRVIIHDDGEVVVYNDNAKIDVHGATSLIEGDYLINEDSVIKLLAMQNDISCLRVHDYMTGHTSFFSATKHNDFDAKMKEITEYIDRNRKSHKDYERQIFDLKNKIESLKEQIFQFNSTRLWYERILKIKE